MRGWMAVEVTREREELKETTVWSYNAIDAAVKLAIAMAETTAMSPRETWRYVRMFLVALNASYGICRATGHTSIMRLLSEITASKPHERKVTP